MKNLTAADRSALIRLARELPQGSEERRAILSGLAKTSEEDPVFALKEAILGSLYEAFKKASSNFKKTEIENYSFILKYDKWRTTAGKRMKPEQFVDSNVVKAIAAYKRLQKLIDNTPPASRDEKFDQKVSASAKRAISGLSSSAKAPESFGSRYK